jgi:pyruvate-formate lyase
MPEVNGEKYPYTKKGIAKAVAAAKAQKKMPSMGQKSKMNPARPKKTMGGY